MDPGLHRTGVASPEAAMALARQISASPALVYGGVQFYCGSQQHIASFTERRQAIAEQTVYLRTVIVALQETGLSPRTITGGGALAATSSTLSLAC